MARELVFVHGRGQGHKDSAALKRQWIDCLSEGLAKNDPPLPPIDDSVIRFPFYGDALDQMTAGTPADEAAAVILKGEPQFDAGTKRFMLAVFDEIRAECGVSDEEVIAAAGEQITEKGPFNWPWVRAVLYKLDTMPQVSAAAIAIATYDVYQYLTNGVIRRKIDTGIMTAMTAGVESVVVSHSLGTVVAYTLLQREGGPQNWNVPLFVTVGSPLAVTAIRNLAPGIGEVGGNRTPACVKSWFNAMDSRDVVSLYPLDVEHFPLTPPDRPIENKTDVDNPTDNRHGISGYLGDPVVAKRIYDAVHAE